MPEEVNKKIIIFLKSQKGCSSLLGHGEQVRSVEHGGKEEAWKTARELLQLQTAVTHICVVGVNVGKAGQHKRIQNLEKK